VSTGIDAVMMPRHCSAWSRSAMRRTCPGGACQLGGLGSAGENLQDTSSVSSSFGSIASRVIAITHALGRGISISSSSF